MCSRQEELKNWLRDILPDSNFHLTKLTGDASHRSYFRISNNNTSKIIMDSPPELVPVEPFLNISRKLQRRGFLLLDDFGDTIFYSAISENSQNLLYNSAVGLLPNMHSCANFGKDLLYFDKSVMLQELDLFNEWFLSKYLRIQPNSQDKLIISNTFDKLTDLIDSQPKVFMHRDYHCRNLMIIYQNSAKAEIDAINDSNFKIGILDYQDAMCGPFTYDLVSILKDCYIKLPNEKVLDWIAYFYERIEFSHNYSLPEFIQAFDLCGLQRHLKVLGIFSRLYLRDNKENYLKNMPLVFDYISSCLECYNDFHQFRDLIMNKIKPIFLNKIK